MRLLALTEDRYHPRELEMALPRGEVPGPTSQSERPTDPCETPDLSRLSSRMRVLISRGNGGEYRSRSEADFAVCLAMFGAGYSEADAWAVMTDPAHGISEKYLEKGRHGGAYLSLTVGKARALVANPT